MDVYIVCNCASFWGVVNYGVILSRSSTSTDAIRRAIETAAHVAKGNGPTQVLVENEDGHRSLIWDSQRDGFTSA